MNSQNFNIDEVKEKIRKLKAELETTETLLAKQTNDYLHQVQIKHRRSSAKRYINEPNWIDTIREIETSSLFLDYYGELNFFRDFRFIYKKNEKDFFKQFIGYSPNFIITSAAQTLWSIKLCVEEGNFADAFILVRKIKDDLLFYTYSELLNLEINNEIREQFKKQRSFNIDDNKNNKINSWLNNKLHLYSSVIFKTLDKNATIHMFNEQFLIRKKQKDLDTLLNKYTHGNGPSFYNVFQHHKNFQKLSSDLLHSIRFCILMSLCQMTLLKPMTVMSSTYTDYIEVDLTPPEEALTEVDPIVLNYFHNHQKIIGEGCFEFLEKHSGMTFIERK